MQTTQSATARHTTAHLPYGVHILPLMLDRNDIARILALPCASTHHDDDGHHIGKEKPTHLPWVAQKLWPFVCGLCAGAHSVDPMMKLYRLEAGRGAVAPHQDRDYDGPDGSMARHSILVFLNDGYGGGETLFEGVEPKEHPQVGGGLFFPHDVFHEGRNVTRGTKFVLKTDLFTLPR